MEKSEQAVLIVDDTEEVCESLKYAFLENGYLVEIAHSFPEAAGKIAKRLFSHVVVDLELQPKTGNIGSFEGIDFFVHVKNRYPDIKRVVISGHDIDVVRQ